MVGSQKFDFTTLGIVSVADIVSMFFKFYRRYQFRKLVRNMKLLVNGKNLVSKNDYDGIPYFIPTNTISEMYYSSKFKKNKRKYIKLLYCGRVEHNKGIFELVSALKL